MEMFYMILMTVASFMVLIPDGSCIKLDGNGKYTQITVRIEDDVPDDDCEELIDNLKALLTNMSNSVGVALSWAVWPGQYTVVLPSHWREDKCRVSIMPAKGQTRFKTTDMVVQSQPAYGVPTPLTLQSRGCGRRGDNIAIAQQFILATNRTSDTMSQHGKLLAHQFVKLRFGIFDERGFPGDPLYPSHYTTKGQIFPTGVSNTEVKGSWLSGQEPCRPGDEGCVFHPQGDNSQVLCSLGFLHDLPSVHSYCRPEDIVMPMAPTKHNVICGGRSAVEVIEDSDDYAFLKRTKSGEKKKHDMVPRIVIVKQQPPKYILLLETSSSMADNDDWKFISKAVKKLIRYDLPDSALLAVVTFSNQSKLEAPLTQVGGSRSHLADIIPDKYRLSEGDDSCVVCGFNMAMTEVMGEHKEAAHVIIITRGSLDSLSVTDEKTIKEYAEYYQIKISSIILSSSTGNFLPIYDDLAHISMGKAYVVKNKGVLQKYREVSKALSELIEDANPRVIVHENTVEISSDKHSTEGQLIVDSMLGQDIQFAIFVEDVEDHLVRSVSFTDNAGAVYGPYTRLATTFTDVNMVTVNFGLGRKSPLSMGIMWRYQVEWYKPGEGGNRTRQASLVFTSRQRADRRGSDYKIQMWTSSVENADIVTAQHPLAVYVAVSRGGLPVLRASVHVTGHVISDNKTVHNMETIELFDNGNGDPDITGDDGVYSKYVTKYPAAGRYTFTVKVTDNNDEAVIVNEEKILKENYCCGSKTNLDQNQLEKTGQFTRIVQGSVINLLQVPDSSHTDQMPPSKIGDLQIKIVAETHSLVATWTSPGNDFDSGNVSGYKVVFSASIADLLTDQGKPMTSLRQFTRNDPAGLKTSYQFQFKHFDEEFYLGLIGVDSANNTGKVSNLVSVVMPAKIHDEEQTVIEITKEFSEAQTDNEWAMILVLCGSFLFIAIFLLFGILYFLKFAKPKCQRTVTDNMMDTNRNFSDPKNLRTHSLMPCMMSVSTTIMPTFISPPASLGSSTPTYWSASQLLAGQIHRADSAHSAKDRGDLSPVREEYPHIENYKEYPIREYLNSQGYHERANDDVTNPVFRHNSVLLLPEYSDTSSEAGSILTSLVHKMAVQTTTNPRNNAGGRRSVSLV